MQASPGSVIATDTLFSNGVALRGKDTPVDQGLAFSFGGVAGVAGGAFSYLQVRNPAGSGKVAYIDEFSFAYGGFNGVATLLSSSPILTGSTPWPKLNLAGPDAKSIANSGASASISGFSIGTFVPATAEVFTYRWPFPVQLNEGQSFIVRALNSNTSISGTITGREFDA